MKCLPTVVRCFYWVKQVPSENVFFDTSDDLFLKLSGHIPTPDTNVVHTNMS